MSAGEDIWRLVGLRRAFVVLHSQFSMNNELVEVSRWIITIERLMGEFDLITRKQEDSGR